MKLKYNGINGTTDRMIIWKGKEYRFPYDKEIDVPEDLHTALKNNPEFVTSEKPKEEKKSKGKKKEVKVNGTV